MPATSDDHDATSDHQSATGRHHRMPTAREVALACEVFALLVMLAANLAAVWQHGPIAIVAAGVVPVILIGATYLFLAHRLTPAWRVPRPARHHRSATWWRRERQARPAVPGEPGWAAWWANLSAAVIILVPVATASYAHQRELLLAAATPTWIATLLPLAVDGLALRAALTLWLPEPAAPIELPAIPGVDPDLVARAAALLAEEPDVGRLRLGQVLDVKDHVARRLLLALRPTEAAA